MVKKRTTGDQNRCECPCCGTTIYDLWDLGNALCTGSSITCPKCGEEVDIVEVDTQVTVVLQSKEKHAQARPVDVYHD